MTFIWITQLAGLSLYLTNLSQRKENFYIFNNKFVSNNLKPVKVEEHQMYLSCMTACSLMTQKPCVVISIVLHSNRYECRFFDNSTNFDNNIEYAANATTYFVQMGKVSKIL